ERCVHRHLALLFRLVEEALLATRALVEVERTMRRVRLGALRARDERRPQRPERGKGERAPSGARGLAIHRKVPKKSGRLGARGFVLRSPAPALAERRTATCVRRSCASPTRTGSRPPPRSASACRSRRWPTCRSSAPGPSRRGRCAWRSNTRTR